MINVDLNGYIAETSEPNLTAMEIFQNISNTNPTWNIYTADGKPVSNNGLGHLPEMIKSGFNTVKSSNAQIRFDAKQKLDIITKGLSARFTYAFDLDNSLGKRMTHPYLLETVDNNHDMNLTGVIKTFGNKTIFTESMSRGTSYTLNLVLNYDRTFNDKHHFSGLALYEGSEGYGDSFWASRTNYIAYSIAQLFAGGETDKNNYGSGFETGRKSWVGRVAYDYQSKYFADASLRYDASVLFPENGRWGLFPSFSAGWRISEENFMKGLPFVDNLKLRASYGELGNDRGIAPFQFLGTYAYGLGIINNGVISQGILKGVEPNPDITWEKAANLNVGFDASFWQGLLGIEFDVFKKRTSDILAKQYGSIPGTYGAVLPDVNYAIVNSKGIEFTLTHQNKIGNFKYGFRGNFNYARAIVEKIDDPVGQLESLKREGRPLGFISGYKALGLFQSDEEATAYFPQFGITPNAGDIKYADLNGDKKIDALDQTVISNYSSIPEILYGINLDAGWKNFDINILFQGAAHKSFLLHNVARAPFFQSTNNGFAFQKDSWSKDNPDAEFTKQYVDTKANNNYDSDWWIRNSSYFRLKNIELGYSMNTELLKKVNIEKFRLFVNATNLFVISPLNKYGFDPEIVNTALYTNPTAYYPQQKVVSFGINLIF